MATFATHMEEEIFSQPQALARALQGRIDLEQAIPIFKEIDGAMAAGFPTRIILVACGSSWHASLVAEYMFEQLARIPVEVVYASEFRYRPLLVDEGTLVIAISQSGEIEDTVESARLVKNAGIPIWGVCNSENSRLTYMTDVNIFLHAGKEYGLASTKAFTCQLAVLTLLAVYFGRKRALSSECGLAMLNALQAAPQIVQGILEESNREKIREVASKLVDAKNFLLLGRGMHFPIALEGALKLKEVSCIHAEGYPAAEMKHGPIALIDEKMPVVIIKQLEDPLSKKIISGAEEAFSRGGKIIFVGSETDSAFAGLATHILHLPEGIHLVVAPIIAAVILQLFAYDLAMQQNLNVDRKRNGE